MTGSTPVFDAFDQVRPYRIWQGAVARAVHGERITLALIDLEPDVAVPEHHHHNEQLGFVVKGSIFMTIAGERRELVAGETYSIRTETPHEALAGPEGATVIDVFSPVRADWEGFERAEPGPGSWPG